MHSSLLTWCNCHLKHLKDINLNELNRRSGELSSHLFEAYRNFVRPHGCHIYKSDAEIAMAKMCPCTSHHHGYHAGNIYCDVVINAPVLVYLVRRQIQTQQTCDFLYIFMFTAMYCVVMFMAQTHMKNEQDVLCVTMLLVL